jgi:DNA-binding CsgD family transcriptional regulator
MAGLSCEDQTLLEMRLNGKRPEQIAAYVQLKPKTIYNKLTQLQRRLLD